MTVTVHAYRVGAYRGAPDCQAVVGDGARCGATSAGTHLGHLFDPGHDECVGCGTSIGVGEPYVVAVLGPQRPGRFRRVFCEACPIGWSTVLGVTGAVDDPDRFDAAVNGTRAWAEAAARVAEQAGLSDVADNIRAAAADIPAMPGGSMPLLFAAVDYGQAVAVQSRPLDAVAEVTASAVAHPPQDPQTTIREL